MRTITYSQSVAFMECRRKWAYRYVREIVHSETPPSLILGSAVHAGIAFWLQWHLRDGAVEAALARGAEMGMRTEDSCKAQVMIEGYCDHWKDDKAYQVETPFSTQIINPRTRRPMREWYFAGQPDAVVKHDDGLWIMEHKTTSSITDLYIQRIAIDAQIALYAWALTHLGTPIKGAIYDIIEKPSCRWRQGETEEEFEARKAALEAKSGKKSSAKRSIPDTYDSFIARCKESMSDDSYRRVEVPLSSERQAEAMQDFLQIARDMRKASIYPCVQTCSRFDGCPYLPLCLTHGDLNACEGLYKQERANSELGRKFGVSESD